MRSNNPNAFTHLFASPCLLIHPSTHPPTHPASQSFTRPYIHPVPCHPHIHSCPVPHAPSTSTLLPSPPPISLPTNSATHSTSSLSSHLNSNPLAQPHLINRWDSNTHFAPLAVKVLPRRIHVAGGRLLTELLSLSLPSPRPFTPPSRMKSWNGPCE